MKTNIRTIRALGRTPLFGAASAVALALTLGCSDGSDSNYEEPSDEPATGESAEALKATVGAEGGSIVGEAGTDFEGLSIEIPAGALAEDTEISIKRTGDTGELPPAALRCGPEYKIEPAGLALEKPAVVTLPYNEETITEQYRFADEVKVWVQQEEGWGREPQLDSSESSVTIELDSFTTLSAGINPPKPEDFTYFDFTPIAANLDCMAAYPGDYKRAPKVEAIVVRGEENDAMFIRGSYFKPELAFDLFSLEKSNLGANGKPNPDFDGFGMAWYQSDMQANKRGNIFTVVRTVLLDQIFGLVLNFGEDALRVPPTNTFHLGFWFNDPEAAVECGFDASKPTPFNGEHKAGPLAMITTPNEETGLGPLCVNPDTSVSPARCNP